MAGLPTDGDAFREAWDRFKATLVVRGRFPPDSKLDVFVRRQAGTTVLEVLHTTSGAKAFEISAAVFGADCWNHWIAYARALELGQQDAFIRARLPTVQVHLVEARIGLSGPERLRHLMVAIYAIRFARGRARRPRFSRGRTPDD